MAGIINEKLIDNALNAAIKAISELPKIKDEVQKKYAKELRKELEYISRTAIDKFYESYEPHKYARSLSFYDAVVVDIKPGNWNFRIDESLMSHGGLNSYIYTRMFQQGWHGGADKGPDHPSPGTPYWKGPIDYHDWYIPAVKTSGPENEIIDKASIAWEEYTNKQQEEYNNKTDLLMSDLLSKVAAII